jgi:outer membrane receptor protein involved in Fe transport
MIRSLIRAATAACLVSAGVAPAQSSTSAPQAPAAPAASADVVVSATKVDEDPAQIAAAVSVVLGSDLRRSGARTVAEALQDVVGIDTGNGSDNGPRMANIGLWGLKEFDALLVTVDGVPVGGPFNPSLSQIPVEDVERIEIVRGPQGTLYGVSAFAGMIQVFTRHGASGGTARLGAGSFGDGHGSASWAGNDNHGVSYRVFGSMARASGWQDRTDSSVDRLSLSAAKEWGGARVDGTLVVYRDTAYFGSPLPVDAGQPVPGFESDRNYAVGGARLDHRVTSFTSNASFPVSGTLKLENTLGLARDEQIQVRSFVGESDGMTATAAGTSLRPVESTVYDDLRLVGEFHAAGLHRLVAGTALTWGRTSADGTGFDFDLLIGPSPVVPDVGDVPVGDVRSFTDRRTFLGFYVNDEWTPTPRLTVTAGARYDSTSESLSASIQETGTPSPDTSTDSRSDGKLSGGVSALFRVLASPHGLLDSANLYVSARSNFKPAAPNLAEAENARILLPETARSGEVGLKTRWASGAVEFDVSLFHMTFENMVVSTVGADGQPRLENAGEERFQGAEISGLWRPRALPGLALSAGYAHHDATFVHFSFLTPDGSLRVVDGKRLELVPRDLWNVRLAYSPVSGPGAFLAVRHQGIRPLTRRNTFYTEAFYESDAGLSWEFPWGSVSAVARNLGDSRHYVSDSEIGDGQFYVATPRRYLAEVSLRF